MYNPAYKRAISTTSLRHLVSQSKSILVASTLSGLYRSLRLLRPTHARAHPHPQRGSGRERLPPPSRNLALSLTGTSARDGHMDACTRCWRSPERIPRALRAQALSITRRTRACVRGPLSCKAARRESRVGEHRGHLPSPGPALHRLQIAPDKPPDRFSYGQQARGPQRYESIECPS